MSEAFTPTTLSNATGISVPYASQLLSGARTASHGLAVKIFRTTGLKLAPIDGLSEEEIAVLEKMGRAA